jgi:hypothetical protein
MIKYPKAFIEKAKRVYPEWNSLHNLLDSGSQFVGRMLYEAQPSGQIAIVRVLNAESLEELQEYARNEVAKAELYAEWTAIYNQHRKDYNANMLNKINASHKRGERLT